MRLHRQSMVNICGTPGQWTPDFEGAMQHYEHLTGVPVAGALDLTDHDLVQGVGKGAAKLRRIYLAVRQSMLYDALPRLRIAPKQLLGPWIQDTRLIHRVSMSWWIADASPLLHESALLLGLKRRMGLPILQAAVPCRYTFQSDGRRCDSMVDVWGQHVGTCSFTGRMARHHGLRDVWVSLAKSAGWESQAEQLIPLPADAPETHKRADIAWTTEEGRHGAGDIAVCTTCNKDGHTWPELNDVTQMKVKAYGVCLEDTELPERRCFYPLLVHADSLLLGLGSLKMLQLLSHSRMRRMAEGAFGGWSTLQNRTLSEFAATLQTRLLKTELFFFFCMWREHLAA